MYSRCVLLILCLAVGVVQSEVKLTKGHNETVSFKGEELTIDVDNTLNANDDLVVCFGSTPEASHQPCPLGFARFGLSVGGTNKVQLIINRQGRFVGAFSSLKTRGDIKFNDDGTLNIMVAQLPDAKTTVTLPNAEIFVPEKPEDEKTVEKKSNGTTIGIGIGVGVVALILLLIGIIVTVGICLYRRKKSQQPIPPPEIVVQKSEVAKTPNPSPPTNNNKEMPPTPKAAPESVPKSPQTPVKTPPTPNATAAESKPTTPPATVPATPPADAAGLQPTSPSTEPVEQPPKKERVNKGKAGTPKAAPSMETTEQTKEPSVDQPEKKRSKHDSKKSLKVEKTQSATVPSPPSIKFSEHPYSKAVAKTSILKEKDNLKYEETANPFTKKIDYSKVDRLTRLELLTESIRCYGMRNGKFTRHDNFVIRERFSTKPHRVHRWEKDIFKATPSEAVQAADALVERIERELKTFGFRPEDDLTQNNVLWDHLNYEEAEMSKFYWLLIQQKPELFEVEEQNVDSEEVREMPIAMLYALILNTKLKRQFREELVVAMRKATVDVIRLTGQDPLRYAAFPLNYLVLLHNKNPSSYVEGRSGRSTGYKQFN